jgi:hypothetical protein
MPVTGTPETDVGKSRPSLVPNVNNLEFRDEQVYLKSIAPYVHLVRPSRKGKETEDDASIEDKEVIVIEWSKVLWITTRNHILTPLVRGLVWYVSRIKSLSFHIFICICRGIAGQYVGPITAFFRGRNKSSDSRLRSGKEGQGVSWLRKWVSSLKT